MNRDRFAESTIVFGDVNINVPIFHTCDCIHVDNVKNQITIAQAQNSGKCKFIPVVQADPDETTTNAFVTMFSISVDRSKRLGLNSPVRIHRR
jgi:hypothetical protein